MLHNTVNPSSTSGHMWIVLVISYPSKLSPDSCCLSIIIIGYYMRLQHPHPSGTQGSKSLKLSTRFSCPLKLKVIHWFSLSLNPLFHQVEEKVRRL